MKVSIIIPFYGRWDLTHSRMMELYTYVQTECSIVLVDDATEGLEHKGGVAWWQKKVTKHSVYYIRNEKNLGFGGSMNRGAKVALKHNAEILVFLSNDVRIFNDFVAEIVRQIKIDKNILLGHRLIDWKAGWNEIGDKVVSYLEGYLLACHKDVWEELGGFDDIYAPYSMEDIDISMSAQQKGFKLIEIPEVKLQHLVGQTAKYTDDRYKITERNKQRFIEKWREAK